MAKLNSKQLEQILSEYDLNNKKPKGLSKFNYSKLLMSIITGLYVTTYIICLGLFILSKPVPTDLLGTIDDVFKIGWVCYCGKAGAENFIKIRKGTKESNDISGNTDETTFIISDENKGD